MQSKQKPWYPVNNHRLLTDDPKPPQHQNQKVILLAKKVENKTEFYLTTEGSEIYDLQGNNNRIYIGDGQMILEFDWRFPCHCFTSSGTNSNGNPSLFFGADVLFNVIFAQIIFLSFLLGNIHSHHFPYTMKFPLDSFYF